MEITIEQIALIVSLTSLLASTTFAYIGWEMNQSQKSVALLSMLEPACRSPQQWALFVEHVTNNHSLLKFSTEDRKVIVGSLNRLNIKANIVNGKLEIENESDYVSP